MISPCIHVCSVDPARRACTGCGRTLAEIGGWTRFTDEQRREIMDLLPGRLAAWQREEKDALNPEPACQ